MTRNQLFESVTLPTFHINRARPLISLLESRGWQFAKRHEIADFAMWCSYGNEMRKARVEQFENDVTCLLDDKRLMHETLCEYGEEGVAPPTFTTLPSYLEYLRATDLPIFCFLKTSEGAGAKGVHLIRSAPELVRKIKSMEDYTGSMIIQQGIRDVFLVDGKKFKVRSYVLVLGDWSVYVYNESLVVLHEVPYSMDSNDRDVHISPPDREFVKRMSELKNLVNIQAQISDIALRSVQCLKQKSGSHLYQSRYHLFGYDFIYDENERLHLIEINAFPNLSRADTMGAAVMTELMRDVVSLVVDPVVMGVAPNVGGFVKLF